MKNITVLLVLLATVVILVGCPRPTVRLSVTGTPESADAPSPTCTPAPTDTPKPKDTPVPTFTPNPTDTPTPPPTDTPVPTVTPEPTATPEPLVFTGSGDSVIDLDRPHEPALVHVIGNAAGRYFSVESYDIQGEKIDLLISTTDPYDGVRLLDFGTDEHATRLAISGQGAWTVEILPLSTARVLEGFNALEGSGDDVIFLERSQDVVLIHIAGNADGRYFAVQSFDDAGGYVKLLVNTTDVYDGIRLLDFMADEYPRWLDVSARGSWTVETVPIETARVLQVPGTVEGIGDDVIRLEGDPDLAIISGNPDERHFSVVGYNDRLDRLVSTTDAYEGTIILHANTVALEIRAVGAWSIEVTE